jgi:hypothetical protein
VKNVALGDEASTIPTDPGDVIDDVVRRSGYYVYRIWLPAMPEDQRTAVFRTIAGQLHDELDCELEAYSPRLIGIAAPTLEAAGRAVRWLDLREREGMLEWEAANTALDDN